MLHIDRILVPTDYSVCADLALAHAMELAHRYEVSVDVVNVAVTAGEPPLSDAVRYWLAADPDRVSHRRVPGVGVVAALLKLVAREAYDLIVIGMHGHSGVRRFVVGSVTDELVREAPCPVLAVREKAGADAAPSIGAILVPTDFSEHAREALHVAVDLARRYEARLDVLHVVPAQALPPAYSIEPVPAAVGEAERRAEEALRRQVEGERPEVPVATHTRKGVPGRVIVETAEALGSDLIVMATHGRSGLRRLLLGSVTERVLHRVPCPLLVVKSFGHSLRAQPATARARETTAG